MARNVRVSHWRHSRTPVSVVIYSVEVVGFGPKISDTNALPVESIHPNVTFIYVSRLIDIDFVDGRFCLPTIITPDISIPLGCSPVTLSDVSVRCNTAGNPGYGPNLFRCWNIDPASIYKFIINIEGLHP